MQRTGIFPRNIFNNDHTHAFVALMVDNCYHFGVEGLDRPDIYVCRLDDPASGSWAAITQSDWWPEGNTVQQGGPRRLWDEAVSAYHRFIELGSPPFGRLGLTVGKDGWSAWLDDESNIIRPPGIST